MQGRELRIRRGVPESDPKLSLILETFSLNESFQIARECKFLFSRLRSLANLIADLPHHAILWLASILFRDCESLFISEQCFLTERVKKHASRLDLRPEKASQRS